MVDLKSKFEKMLLFDRVQSFKRYLPKNYYGWSCFANNKAVDQLDKLTRLYASSVHQPSRVSSKAELDVYMN